MKEKIIDAGDNRYCSDFMVDLPNNTRLNKVLTGCGATSVALSNDVKYVVAMPYINLIINKKNWAKQENIEVFDLCSDCTFESKDRERLLEFKGNKIITTYDGVKAITEQLEEMETIKDWKLCVDEYQQLLMSGALRWNAISNVFACYEKYKSWVLITAQPPDEATTLPELKSLHKTRIEWNNTKEVTVKFKLYEGDLNIYTSNLVRQHIQGEKDGNAYIFINSVKAIVKVLKTLENVKGCTPENIRVVCSTGNKFNYTKLKSVGYEISNVPTEKDGIKKVTFLTATAFEGCDIYDANGKTYMITDGSVDHTKIDIATTLPQVIGRVRDSKYNGFVKVIFTASRYVGKGLTAETFKIQLDKEMVEARNLVQSYKKLKAMDDGSVVYQFAIIDFIRRWSKLLLLNVNDDGDLVVNEGAYYGELNAYTTIRETYSISSDPRDNGIVEGVVENNGTIYNWEQEDISQPSSIERLQMNIRPNKSKLIKEYVDGMTSTDIHIIDTTNQDFINQGWIRNAYKKLGAEAIINCGYQESRIKNLLANLVSLKDNVKVLTKLKLKAGERYSNKDLKMLVQMAYEKAGFNLKAKATDIKLAYNTKPTKVGVNGKRVRGIQIISLKS